VFGQKTFVGQLQEQHDLATPGFTLSFTLSDVRTPASRRTECNDFRLELRAVRHKIVFFPVLI